MAVIILAVDNGNHKIEDPLSITISPFHDLTCGEQTNWSFQEAKVNGVLKSLLFDGDVSCNNKMGPPA